MNENEEFEFRLRAEQESKSASKEATPKTNNEVVQDKKEKFLPSSGKEVVSEAAKVVGQGIVGMSGDILDIGNKPIAEILAGEVGKNIELGALLQKNIDSRIKAFAMSGMVDPKILAVADSETLHTKIGFPVPPQPETGLGKILGLSARIAGNVATAKVSEAGVVKAIKNSRFNLPSSEQIDSAIIAVESNVQTAKDINKVKLNTANARIKFEEDMINKVHDSEKLSELENTKANIAYSRAQEIHGKPGESGLAIKASKKLNEKYWKEAKPYYNRPIYVEDVRDGLKTVLQKHGVLDGNGDVLKDANLSTNHAKALKLYESLSTKQEGAVRDVLADMKKVKAGKLKKKFESTFGRNIGGDNLVQEVFGEVAQYIDGIKKINTKFVSDYQMRNAVYDKFNIFNKIGWRKGSASIEPGAKFLENLADANPAKVNRDYLQMDDFLYRYTGESVSEPVKALTGEMIEIRDSAIERNFRNQIDVDSLESRIIAQETRSKTNAQSIKANLEDLKKLSLARERRIKWLKTVGAVSAATTTATIVGGKMVEFVKKILP